MSDMTFADTMCYKCIYVLEINDHKHRGLVKVGEATVYGDHPLDELTPRSEPLEAAAHERINDYTTTAGTEYNLLYTEVAVREEQVAGRTVRRRFSDNDVRRVLLNSGVENVKIGNTGAREWYRCGLPTAKKAIAAVKAGEPSLPGAADIEFSSGPITLYPKQREAVDKTRRRFASGNRMLWNAKMRFGKTVAALELVRQMGFAKTVILTHRPAVIDQWHKDFNLIFVGDTEYLFGWRDGATLDQLINRGKPFIYFASIEDARGSDSVDGKYQKNKPLFDTLWDLVIIDEAHEGTTTKLGVKTVDAIVKEEEGHTKKLELSGTPFNIIEGYKQKEIFTWDYVMEQEEKRNWYKNHLCEHNPYEDLPELSIYTYDLGSVFDDSPYAGGDGAAFNFREFFRVWTGDIREDLEALPEDASIGDFVHKGAVRSFLNLLVAEDADTSYPYSTERYRDMFRHTLWMVPGVNAAKALKRLMLDHPVFGSGAFDILNVAGLGDDEIDAKKALPAVRAAIREANALGNYTITLSCSRLTTGVTVKEWSAVLMLSGSKSTSAANYLQTIFRVQSPGEIDGKAKERAYVFDFAPDRALKMVAEAVKVSTTPGKTDWKDKQRLTAFLNFCPVIALSGSRMTKFDTPHLMQHLKRAYADRVVDNGFKDDCLYTDRLLQLNQDDADAFEDLRIAINKTKTEPIKTKITINRQGLTEEEYEKAEEARRRSRDERTDEEQELIDAQLKAKADRRKAIELLRHISIRMPLLIFGADIPLSTDLTIDAFVDLVDDASWEQFMPQGVDKELFSKFRRFYDEDVFIAAGRRIRDIARHADTLDPTRRARSIGSLFSHFHNPDKETVLTPWYVINMQVADCLGGWDFYNPPHSVEDLRDEPIFVSRNKVTTRTLGDASSKILEMYSKTGLYPLYVAHSIYKSRLGNRDGKLSVDEKNDLWFSTVIENVFALCTTQMAQSITRRVLVGYSGRPTRIACHEDLLAEIKQDREKVCNEIKNPGFWGMEGDEMEFSAIVGNPAYQLRGGGHGNSAMPVYQEFVKTAIDLSPDYISMITPSRWFTGGRGLDVYRDAMIHDRHMARIVDFPMLYDPFPNVKIRGGISYFLWDKAHDGPCSVQTMMLGQPVGEAVERDIGEFDVLVRRNEAVPILRKVRERGEPTLDLRVSSTKPFGLRTYSHGKDSPDGLKEPVKFYGSQKRTWMERSEVPQNSEWIDKWKVLLTAVQGTSGSIEKRHISSPIIAGPGTACSETYVVAGQFETEEEARNYASYLRTRFVRMLVSCRKLTQHAPRDVFAFVPDLEYDHEWTDEMLYERYGIEPDEVKFIESIVMPLDE